MEPFEKPGQELQALNRCHRIGQERPVSCTIYYAQRTTEERALAFREVERQQVPGLQAEMRTGSDEAEAISLLAEAKDKQEVPAAKLRFLLGAVTSASQAEADDDAVPAQPPQDVAY